MTSKYQIDIVKVVLHPHEYFGGVEFFIAALGETCCARSNMDWSEGRRLAQEVNLRNVVSSRRQTDIGKANPRLWEYFGVIMILLGESQSALQDRIRASLTLKVVTDPRCDRNRSRSDL